ncbi:hypothetical protein [Desulfobulbus propionicus]
MKFAPAKAHFNRVLSALPDHAAARAGLESVCFWEDLLRRIEPLPDPNGPMLLWQTIVQHPLHRNEAEKALRTTLIRFLLTRLEQAGLAFIEPDLSTGHLYLLPEHPPDTPAVQAQALLRQAEQARHQNDHTGMVTARKLLQHLAPEIFNDSLQWLVAQSEPDSTTGYTKKNPEQDKKSFQPAKKTRRPNRDSVSFSIWKALSFPQKAIRTTCPSLSDTFFRC